MRTKEVCPICTRDRKSCTFFKRVAELKFDEDPSHSGRLRSKFFRLYHADICEICKRDVAHCHEVKVAAIVREAKKAGQYMTDDRMADELKAAKCHPPSRFRGQQEYTPIMPYWWRPADDRDEGATTKTP